MIVDALGRKHPRPLGWELLLEAVPGLARRFKPIPERFFYATHNRLYVRCPCSASPYLEGGWDVTECLCGRYFLSCGGKVFCALKSEGETAEPPAGVSAGRS